MIPGGGNRTDGFASWDAYWRDVGVPEEELGAGARPWRISAPAARSDSKVFIQVVNLDEDRQASLGDDLTHRLPVGRRDMAEPVRAAPAEDL